MSWYVWLLIGAAAGGLAVACWLCWYLTKSFWR